MDRGDTSQSGVIRGFYPVFPKSYETIFVWASYFCLFNFCTRGEGHEFWTHLKMCILIFDLLPLILNNGTGNGEMRSSGIDAHGN